MRKTILAILVMALGVMLSGCGSSNTPMDKQAEDGNYYYENNSLNFAVTLPSEFEYYQTQRKEVEDYVDIEFFIPTSDTQYTSQVPGYARPFTVRVFDQEVWEEEVNSDAYEQVGSQNDYVYSIKFWEETPNDWQDKWTEDMKQGIIDSFQLQ